MLKPLYYTEALLYVSTFKGPFSGSTDTFHEPGQQNMCPDENIRLKSNILYVLCSDVNIRVYAEVLGCINCNKSSTLIPLMLFIAVTSYESRYKSGVS